MNVKLCAIFLLALLSLTILFLLPSNDQLIEEPKIHTGILPPLAEGESLIVVKTTTHPSFLLVIPDPFADKINPLHIYQTGSLHPKFTVLLTSLMSSACKEGKIFVDVGAYIGYFSLLAATLGCQVIAVEGNPHTMKTFQQSIALNGLNNIHLFENLISDKPTGSLQTLVLYPGQWGLSFNKQLQESTPEGAEHVVLQTIRLDDIIDTHVFILKIDVEASELEALNSGRQSLKKYNIENIFIEWDKVAKKPEAGLLLQDLHQQGYDVFGLPGEAYKENIRWNDHSWHDNAVLIDPSQYGQVPHADIWLKKIDSHD